jgi:hypothetical protein
VAVKTPPALTWSAVGRRFAGAVIDKLLIDVEVVVEGTVTAGRFDVRLYQRMVAFDGTEKVVDGNPRVEYVPEMVSVPLATPLVVYVGLVMVRIGFATPPAVNVQVATLLPQDVFGCAVGDMAPTASALLLLAAPVTQVIVPLVGHAIVRLIVSPTAGVPAIVNVMVPAVAPVALPGMEVVTDAALTIGVVAAPAPAAPAIDTAPRTVAPARAATPQRRSRKSLFLTCPPYGRSFGWYIRFAHKGRQQNSRLYRRTGT